MHSDVTTYVLRLQAFNCKRPHPFFRAGSWAAYGKITVHGIPNRLYYCVIFIVYTKFTGMAAGRSIQPAGTHAASGPWVGYPRYTHLKNKNYLCSSDTQVWMKTQIGRKKFGGDECNFRFTDFGLPNSYTLLSTDWSVKRWWSIVTGKIVALDLNSVCANITMLLQSCVLYSTVSNEEFSRKYLLFCLLSKTLQD
jgi:hypothetical protein